MPGTSVYVSDAETNDICHLAIDPDTGGLTLQSRQAVGGMPNWIEIVDLP